MEKAGQIILKIMDDRGIGPSELAGMMGVDRRNLHQTLHKNQDIKYSQFVEILGKLGYKVEITENSGH